MEQINQLIRDVPVPRMVPVRQVFDKTCLDDVEATLRSNFQRSGLRSRIKPGDSIALGVGSRGLAQLPLLVRVTVDELRQLGAEPFIVPTMGSHAGASAKGQELLLNGLGITESAVGCEIRSSMETVELGRSSTGLPILMDKRAMEADGIAFVCRVKPHTSFTATYESGLCKMLTIGFGKQQGAESCHAQGFGRMASNVLEMAQYKLAHTKVLFGVATVENAYDKIARADVVLAEDILTEEPAMLEQARASMPKILFNPVDLLVVDKMGKEFSGTGCDPNITGRPSTPFIKPEMQATRFVILDISLKSGGNAAGIGLADIITRRLYDKVDLAATYMNQITSTAVVGGKIPMTMDTARLAVQCAIKTSNVDDFSTVKAVNLTDTLHLEDILISEALLDEAREHPNVEVMGEPRAWMLEDAKEPAVA